MKKGIFVSVLALGVILPLIVSAAWWPFSMMKNRGNDDAKIKELREKSGLSITPNNRPKSGVEVSIECVANLIDTREVGFASAWITYTTAESTALSIRRVDLAAAWKVADVKARNTAVQEAGSKYSKAHKLAAQNYRDSVKTAHVAYETAKKTCKILPTNDAKELVPTPELN